MSSENHPERQLEEASEASDESSEKGALTRAQSRFSKRVPRPGGGGGPGGGGEEKRPTFIRWALLGVFILIAIRLVLGVEEAPTFTLDEVREGIRAQAVTEVELHVFNQALSGVWLDTEGEFFVHFPESMEAEIISELEESGVAFETSGPMRSNRDVILTIVQLAFIGGLIYLVMVKMGPKSMSGFAGGKRHVPVERPRAGFEALGGLDEAIEEVAETVEFLSDPSSFLKAGARPPRGVLLEGPPGTGKTALARAVAAEANVPFFSTSGSDFVEMFVGVGASRIRGLFKQARDAGPAIIFIDEIDAIGRRRSGGMGHGSNEETERTLNQLLVEMDGFDNESGVIIMAATNRADTLDAALTRPGRFDRRVQVPLPDPPGRLKILQVHSAGRRMAEDVNLEALAAQTTGFSGAQLEALINEAAILVAREKGELIYAHHLQSALERVALGPERKSAKISDLDRQVTAYHEAGHALVAWVLPEADAPRKVTIIPRGPTGGATWMVPSDRAYLSKKRGLAYLAVAMGGRAGEELLLEDDITAGASHDIQSATTLAKKMIGMYGMDPEVGLIFYGTPDGRVAGSGFSADGESVSQETARLIEGRVVEMNTAALERAREVLLEYRGEFEKMVELLLEREHLSEDELAEILGPMPGRR